MLKKNISRRSIKLVSFGVGPQCRKFFCCINFNYEKKPKFLRLKPWEAYSRGLISVHIPINSICSIMITIFTPIKFSKTLGEMRKKYVLHEHFYFYSIQYILV